MLLKKVRNRVLGTPQKTQIFDFLDSRNTVVFNNMVVNITDFLGALLELREEQALVFFGDKAGQPIIATQYGFRIYGTD